MNLFVHLAMSTYFDSISQLERQSVQAVRFLGGRNVRTEHFLVGSSRGFVARHGYGPRD
jgi:hypothetical protein